MTAQQRSDVAIEKGETVSEENGVVQGERLLMLQKLLLAMLLEVDRICRKHQIQYFLAGGTLLGAIRHQGFIPWDDDVDIMMLREEYEKFQKVAATELPEALFLQLPNYNPYTRIRINDTVFASEFMMRFPDIHNGIFLDLFAHDRTGVTARSQKLHRMVTKVTRSIVFNKWGNTDVKGDGSHPIIRWLVSRLKDLLPMPLAVQLRDRTLVWFRKKKTGYLYDGMGQNVERGAFSEAWLKEAVYVDFEGYALPVPKEYDRYLRWLYGEYMQLPPEEKRHASHETVRLDFGRYETKALLEMPAEEIFCRGNFL